MNLALPRALEQLIGATRAFLAQPEPTVFDWELYMTQRTELLAALENLSFPAADLAAPAVVVLKEELFAQESALKEKACVALAKLGEEIRGLGSGRRALQGYATLHAASLLERMM